MTNYINVSTIAISQPGEKITIATHDNDISSICDTLQCDQIEIIRLSRGIFIWIDKHALRDHKEVNKAATKVTSSLLLEEGRVINDTGKIFGTVIFSAKDAEGNMKSLDNEQITYLKAFSS